MATTVTRTKIIVPRRRADLLSRPRLTSLLDDLLDYKLILLAAPAGYGKTSLLVDWARQKELPVGWYALDPLDQDIHRFISHFIAAIAQIFPDFGQQSEAVLQSTDSDIIDLNRIMPTIVNEAYDNIKEHFAIVLDDFHTVDSSEEVNDFINRFVDEVDENCHLIIASRTLVSFENLPLMVGRSMVKGLSYDELAFKADEIQALLKQNYQQTITTETAVEIERETEGWITGLLLSAQTMWLGMTDRQRVSRASGVHLYDYLAQQVLNQQPAIIQDFLLKTSLLEEFDADLCEAVFGAASEGTNWNELIRDVLQNNLFVLPVENKGTWLRYHHLFRDFLQAKIKQESPASADSILTRLAEAYTSRGEWEEAHEIYHSRGDKVGLVHLIEQAGTPLLKNGQLGLLRKFLSGFSSGELREHPSLLSLQGALEIILGNVELGISFLDRAENSFQARKDFPKLAKALTRRASAYRFLGDYQKAISDIDEVLSIVDGNPVLRDIQAEAFRVRGLCLHSVGQLATAIEHLEKSLSIYNSLGDSQNNALLQLDLGFAHMSAGHFDQSLIYYKEALAFWRQTGNIIRLANVLNNLGVFHHLRGEYDQAGNYLIEAFSLAQKSGNTRIEAYSLASLGDIFTDLDAYDAAREIYRQAREISLQIDNRFLLLYVDLAEAAINRMTGDLAGASQKVNEANKYIEEGGSAYERGLYYLHAGQISLSKRDLLEAVDLFEKAIHCFEEGGQNVEVVHAYMGLSQTHNLLNNLKAAIPYLELALRDVPNARDTRTLIVAGREARDLLNKVATVPSLIKPAAQLIKEINRFENAIPEYRLNLRQQSAVIAFAHPPKISIQALGTAQVFVDSEPVTVPEWSNQKAVRELFFLLLAHPEGSTKEVIGSILWSDSSPKQLKMQFKNALYRMRRALGKDIIVFTENEDSYRFNRSIDYEYDVEAFHSFISKAKSTSDLKQRMIAYRHAFSLYKGHFLQDIDGLWVLQEREQLWQAYLIAGLELARTALANKYYQDVLDDCRKILLQDSCQEEAHRLAMQAYAAIGNRAELVRQFETCKASLDLELGVSPSPQTLALYQRLMA